MNHAESLLLEPLATGSDVRISRRSWLLAAAGVQAVHAADRPPAPEFSLRRAEGGKLALSSLKGRVVVLNFWATWCEPCRVEMPWFNELHKERTDEGLTIVGLSLDARGWRAVTPFLAQYRIEYPVVVASPAVAKAYEPVEPLPTTLFLDRRLRIVARHHGLISKGYLAKVVDLLLSEKEAQAE